MSDEDTTNKSAAASLRGGRPFFKISSIELAERYDEIQQELAEITSLINDPDLGAQADQREDNRLALQALSTRNALFDIVKAHQELAAKILIELKIRRVIPLI